jgi:acyl carrier protein
VNVRINRKRVAWQRVGEEILLVDVAGGKVIGLNPVATFVWSEIESLDIRDLAGKVSEEFQVSAEEAEADLVRFVGSLKERGFLQVMNGEV